MSSSSATVLYREKCYITVALLSGMSMEPLVPIMQSSDKFSEEYLVKLHSHIASWLAENRSKLVFDPDRNCYKLSGER